MESIFLPERLKKIRENRGLNKAEAARLLGLSKMGYLRYESAARTPSYQTIVFIAQKLGTSPDYLTGISDNPEPEEYVISSNQTVGLLQEAESLKNYMKKRGPSRILLSGISSPFVT